MQTHETTTTLLSELGGRDAVELVVAAFYDRVLADPLLKDYFRGVQMSRLYKNQTDFFCAVLGNEPCYRGRDMRTVHAGMNISDEEFDAVAGHLVEALKMFDVPDGKIGEVVALIAPLRADVVTRKPAPSALKQSFYGPKATCPVAAVKGFPWRYALLCLAVVLAALAGAFAWTAG